MKTAILLIAAQIVTSVAIAQTKPAAAPAAPAPKVEAQQPRSSDKVDLKKLEDKYWSAKDEDYSVIQNRTFSKSGKLYLSAVYGTLMNDPFAKSKPFGANVGYYFTEDFGIEASYLSSTSEPSDSVTKFKSLGATVKPNYNLPGNSYALSATYTPFYAKLAFMNMAIMYFDMGFTAGFGMSEYEQVVQARDGSGVAIAGQDTKVKQTSPHFEIGIMQQLFLSKNFAFRLDIKNSFFNEKIAPYDNTATGAKEESASKNNTYITFGLTLFTN